MAEKIISHVLHYDDEAVLVLTDGTRLNLTEADIEMIELAFPGACEACGFDPNNEPSYEEN